MASLISNIYFTYAAFCASLLAVGSWLGGGPFAPVPAFWGLREVQNHCPAPHCSRRPHGIEVAG
jgi:hypothetical protein